MSLTVDRVERLADEAANRVMEDLEGRRLAASLEGGNVTEIERAFYEVFRRIYLAGYAQGQAAALGEIS